MHVLISIILIDGCMPLYRTFLKKCQVFLVCKSFRDVTYYTITLVFLETAFFYRLGHDFLLIYYLILLHIERGRQNTAGGDNM